jgi:hypothetical protein
MGIKDNINKIHGDLSSVFENIEISEKSNKRYGNFFEISILNEGANLKMILPKSNIENDTFGWEYYGNPLNENSDMIERISNIDNVKLHAMDILHKKRFNKEYIESISK